MQLSYCQHHLIVLFGCLKKPENNPGQQFKIDHVASLVSMAFPRVATIRVEITLNEFKNTVIQLLYCSVYKDGDLPSS
jgi:hypothetical protein